MKFLSQTGHPHSPDLNHIENAWSKLKEHIYKTEPGLENLTGSDEEIRTVFARAIERAWEDLGQDFTCNGLIKSMDGILGINYKIYIILIIFIQFELVFELFSLYHHKLVASELNNKQCRNW